MFWFLIARRHSDIDRTNTRVTLWSNSSVVNSRTRNRALYASECSTLRRFETEWNFSWHFTKKMPKNVPQKPIGATKVARSSEISDRGHFVANFVYFFHIFSKKYLNIFEKEHFLWKADEKIWRMISNMLGQSRTGAELTHLDQYSLGIFCPMSFA